MLSMITDIVEAGIVEAGIVGGAGYLLIRILSLGRVRSDCNSSKLLWMQDEYVTVGWFVTNLVGVLFWIGIFALTAVLLG